MGQIRFGQSGYHGFSMSNRAVTAYECGEKPISKFTKKDLAGVNQFIPEGEKPLRVTELKGMLKRWGCSSWHHTSKWANKTEFYSVAELFDLRACADYEEPEGFVEDVDEEAVKTFLLRLRAYRDNPNLEGLI